MRLRATRRDLPRQPVNARNEEVPRFESRASALRFPDFLAKPVLPLGPSAFSEPNLDEPAEVAGKRRSTRLTSDNHYEILQEFSFRKRSA